MDTSANLPSTARRTETVLSPKGGLELEGPELVAARVSPIAGCRNTLFQARGREVNNQAKREVSVRKGGWGQTDQRKQEAKTMEKRRKERNLGA